MTTDALKQLSIPKLATGIILEWTRSDLRRCRLYLSDARMTTQTPDSKPFQVALVGVTDMVQAGEDLSFSCTISSREFFAVEIYPGYTYAQYDGLEALLQAYPEILYAATVKVVLEAIADDLSVTYKQVIVGTVEDLVEITNLTATFGVRLRDAAAEKDVPFRETGVNAIHTGERAFDDVKGAVLPVTFGDWHPSARWSYAQSWLKYAAGVFGWKIPTAAAIPVSRATTGTPPRIRAAYCEYVDGGLVPDYTGHPSAYLDLGGRLARLYSGWWDQAGTLHPGADGEVSSNAKHFHVRLDERPYVQVPYALIPFSDTDAKRLVDACDGNPDTYARVPAVTTAKWDLPRVSLPGRMSMNTTDAGSGANDYEGAYAPVGIKLLVLVANASATPITGSVTIALQFDDGVVYLNGTAYQCQVSATLALTQNVASLIQLNIPYKTGTIAQGWAGTKWQTGDFSGGAEGVATHPDYAVWRSGCENYPMKLAVTNTMSGELAVVGVALLVGARAYSQVVKSTVTLKGGKEVDFTTGVEEAIDWSRVTGRPPKAGKGHSSYTGFIQELYDRQLRTETERAAAARRPTGEVSNVRYAGKVLKDDASGTYTGTAEKVLVQPIEISRAYLQIYGGISSANICQGTELGSYEVAREWIRKWYSGGVSSLDWSIMHQLLDRMAADEAADRVLEECVGLTRRKYPNGKHGWHHWGPVDSLDASRLYDSGNPIDPTVHLQLDGDPRSKTAKPAISFGHSGGRSVVNRLRVLYRGGLEAVATCDADGSNDGTESAAAWPAVPYSFGMLPGGAGGLCAVSQARFGPRRATPVDMSHTSASQIAVAAGLYRVARRWQPEPFHRCYSGLGLYDLWEGHVYRWSNKLQTVLGHVPTMWGAGVEWEDLWWMCVGKEIGSDGVCDIRAIWLPYNLGPMGRGGAFGGDEEEILLSEGL